MKLSLALQLLATVGSLAADWDFTPTRTLKDLAARAHPPGSCYTVKKKNPSPIYHCADQGTVRGKKGQNNDPLYEQDDRTQLQCRNTCLVRTKSHPDGICRSFSWEPHDNNPGSTGLGLCKVFTFTVEGSRFKASTTSNQYFWNRHCYTVHCPQCENKGLTECDGKCVNTDINNNYCGGCTNGVCQGGSSCLVSACSCDNNEENPDICYDDSENEFCTNFQKDDSNCGSCNSPCTVEGSSCSADGCVCPTDTPETCDNKCVTTVNNDDYCGNCQTQCAADEFCDGNTCACSGGENYTHCDGTCTNVVDNDDHCGTCDNKCKPGTKCKGKTCVCNNEDETICTTNVITGAQKCFDLTKAHDHCGACETKCSIDTKCVNSNCVCTTGTKCGTGLNAVCVDTNTNPDYCGTDCQPCDVGEVCRGGTCVRGCDNPGTCDTGFSLCRDKPCKCFQVDGAASLPGVCYQSPNCESFATCSTSEDCDEGYSCATGTCCDEPVCVPNAMGGRCPNEDNTPSKLFKLRSLSKRNPKVLANGLVKGVSLDGVLPDEL